MMDSSWLRFVDLKPHIIVAVLMASIAVLFLEQGHFFFLDELPRWALAATGLVMILSGVLTLANSIKALSDMWKRHQLVKKKRNAAEEARKSTLRFLDTLSQEELEVLSYLVTKGKQSFTVELNAKKLVTLVQKGLVTMQHGTVSMFNVAYTIPHFVWDELTLREDEFTTANISGPHPWRERRI